MTANPYQAPKSVVADHIESSIESGFLVEPRSVPAARGWTWIVLAWGLFKQSPMNWLVVLLLALGANIALQVLPLAASLVLYVSLPALFGLIALVADGIWRGHGSDLRRACSRLSEYAGRLAVLGLIYAFLTSATMFLAFLPVLGVGGIGMLLGLQTRPAAPVGSLWTGLALYWALGIPLAMSTYFAPTLVVLQDKTPLQAIRLSFVACRRNILAIVVFLLSATGLGIVACLPVGLGLLVLAPVLLIAAYTGYRDVFFST